MGKGKHKGGRRTGGVAPPLTTFKGHSSTIRMVVTSVRRGEPGGDYVVCLTVDDSVLPKGTSVTFDLENWVGPGEPKKGQLADGTEVYEFKAGWRAGKAQPVEPGQQRKAATGGSRG